VARTFTDSYFLGNFTEQLGDDFDESQQALSQRDRRPLTWKAVQIAATRRIFQFVGQNQVARTFTDSYFLGNFTEGDDFDE